MRIPGFTSKDAPALSHPIAVTMMLGLLFGTVFCRQDVHGAELSAAGSRVQKGALQVTGFRVQATRYAETVSASGTILADEDVELRAEIGGRVVSIAFREGAQIAKGDLLIKLDDAELRAMRRRAVHRRDLAILRERRLSQLVEQNLVRREEYDTALSELHVQEAEIAVVDAQISKTEIRAPFAGTIGLRYVSEGAFVNAASRLATLHRLSRVKIDFSIPERYVSALKTGMPIRVASASGEQTMGRVYAIDPRVDPLTRTCTLRAVVLNTEGLLHPGGSAEVQLTLEELGDAIFIPADAMLSSAEGKHVFVIEGEIAELRQVQSTTRTENSVRIVSGLRQGEIVVTSGLQQLRSGSRVVLASLSHAGVGSTMQGAQVREPL